MMIIDNGRSDYQILTPGRYRPAETFAAGNLQQALFEMTGVRLPVRAASLRVKDRPALIVGCDAQAAQPGLWDKDSYAVAARGRDLVLSGSSPRAVHYAVFAFLEAAGARFYGPDAAQYPRCARVALPARPVSSTSAFGYRHVFYPTAQEPEWAIRWKLNVHNGRDARWGANAAAHSFGHSFSSLVPVQKHFARHPEYFSLVDGRRRDHQQQLCCSNPAVADAAAETMAQWIAANPDRRIFAVGMNDWHGWCECPDCARIDRREGSPTGQLITLVNRVADKFPDRIIATLAYSWAIEPPRSLHARDNVLVVLCHNHGCYVRPLAGCRENSAFIRRLDGWKRKSRHILIWDYFVNYHSYLMPTPNLERIQQDIKLYRDAGVEGMFCQGSACRGGQFEGLRQFLLSQCLWNPDTDVWSAADAWLRGMYGGAAGGAILDYLLLLHTHVRKNGVHMHSFGSGQEIQPGLFTPDVLKKGKALWDKAERAAGSRDARRKVCAARAPEMCSRLFHAGIAHRVSNGRLAPRPAPDMKLKERFVRAALLGGAAHLREDAGAPEDFARNYGRTYRAEILKAAPARVVVIPGLGGRIYSLEWLPRTLELMRVIDLTRFVNFSPYDAGYEFSTEPLWHGNGASEEYRVTGRTACGVRMRAESGGLRIESAFSLGECAAGPSKARGAGTPAAGVSLSISHTVTNRGTQKVTIAPVTHPEWRLDAFGDDARIALRGPGGTWAELPLNPEGREDRDLEFAGSDMPRGAWRIISKTNGIAVEETFDARRVRRCHLLFSRRRGNLNLELWFRPVTLAPGASAVFATRWRIVPAEFIA
ncbi:DUF4838 domain-containing protein [bacterium]|nr:DUF4838 domain-containing protein [bacterium]